MNAGGLNWFLYSVCTRAGCKKQMRGRNTDAVILNIFPTTQQIIPKSDRTPSFFLDGKLIRFCRNNGMPTCVYLWAGIYFIFFTHFQLKTTFSAPTRNNKWSPVEDTLTTEWKNKTKQKPVFFSRGGIHSPWLLGSRGQVPPGCWAKGSSSSLPPLQEERLLSKASWGDAAEWPPASAADGSPGHRLYIINLPASY